MTKTLPKQTSKMAAALLERAQAYATLIGRELSTVSVYLFNDGKVLKSLQEGRDIYTRQYERGIAELDARIAKLTAPAQPVASKPAPAKKAAPKKAAAKKAPVKAAKVAPPPKAIQQPPTQAMQARTKAAPRQVAKPK